MKERRIPMRSISPLPVKPGTVSASRRRRIAILGAVLAASGLLTACAGSEPGSSGSSPPGRSRAPANGATAVSNSAGSDARTQVTAVQARAFARAVNLTVSDVPEASIDRGKETRENPGERRELAHCESFPGRGRTLIAARSPQIKRGEELETEEIRSYVTVLANGRRAATELATLGSRGVRECVARVLSRRFAAKSVREAHWGRVTVSSIPVHAPGAEGTIGIRVSTTLTLSFSEISVPIYFDVLGFTSGPDEVAMSAASVTQPVPPATEQRLLSLLLARAETHAL